MRGCIHCGKSADHGTLECPRVGWVEPKTEPKAASKYDRQERWLERNRDKMREHRRVYMREWRRKGK